MTNVTRAAVRKVLHVFETGDEARWYARASLLAAGPGRVGASFVSLPQLVMQVGTALWGEGASADRLDVALRAILSAAPFRGAFVPLEKETRAARLLRRSLLQVLVAVQQARSMGAASPVNLSPRDERVIALADAFAVCTEKPGKRTWHAGHVRAMLDAGARELPLVRDLHALVHAPEVVEMTWVRAWLESLAPGRLDSLDVAASEDPADVGDATDVVEHACGSPIVEVVTAARLFFAAPHESLAVLVPPREVSTWASRLNHLDVPVLAYLGGEDAPSAAERLLDTAADLLAGRGVEREALRELLTTRRLAWRPRQQVEASEPIDDGAPQELERHAISEAQIGRHFGRQRAATGTLEEWRARLELAKAVGAREGGEGEARSNEAHDALLSRLDRLACARTASAMLELLRDLAFQKRGGYLPAERSAAKSVIDRLKISGHRPFAEVWSALARDGVGGVAGAWMDRHHAQSDANGGEAAVWVVPWSARPERLPGMPTRRVLAGLDAFPARSQRSPWTSPQLLAGLGLRTGAERAAAGRTSLEAMLERKGLAVVSHRTHDGGGATVVSTAWLSRWRTERATSARVHMTWPREALTAHSAWPLHDGYVFTPAERSPADEADFADLSRRIEAVHAHGAETISPWTGDLGVRLQAGVYSVSSLQRFALNPYRYFLERVLGLKEEDALGDDLDAREQGTVTHAALEAPIASRQASNGGAWIDFAAEFEGIVQETRSALADQYGSSLGALLTEVIRASSVERWGDELEAFLQSRLEELNATKDKSATELASEKNAHGERIERIAFLEEALAEPFTTASVEAACIANEKSVSLPKKFKAALAGDAKELEELRAELINKKRLSAKAILGAELRLLGAPGSHAVAAEKHLEVRADKTPDGVDIPLALAIPGYEPIHVRGSVDRLEHCSRRGFVVVDFKSGAKLSVKELKEKIASGEHLQLPLYAVAVEQLAAAGRIRSRDGQGAHEGTARVGAVMLANLKRHRESDSHAAVAIDPHAELKAGQSAVELARRYAHAFREAIEAGCFLLADRQKTKAGAASGSDAFARAMRFIPTATKKPAEVRAWRKREAPPNIPLAPEHLLVKRAEGAETP